MTLIQIRFIKSDTIQALRSVLVVMGSIKEKTAQQYYTNTDECKKAVTYAFSEVTPQMLTSMSDKTCYGITVCYYNDE